MSNAPRIGLPSSKELNRTLIRCVLPIALSALFAASASGQAAFPNPGLHPTPEGFSQYLVYMANGVFDPTAPHPTIPGCFGGECPGDYFQSVIMERSPMEILEEEQEAKDFFLSRFGIDVDDPDLAGRIFYASFMLDPRGEYRAFSVSGSSAPPEGWVVNDGGFRLIFLDPAGVPLGGEFAGQVAPPGSVVIFGNYNIEVTKSNGKPLTDVVYRYRSREPVIPDANIHLFFVCEIEHPELGVGTAQGLSVGGIDPATGLFRYDIRNVVTFPEH